jgi:tetratricopeptide (TPR) repeat protein
MFGRCRIPLTFLLFCIVPIVLHAQVDKKEPEARLFSDKGRHHHAINTSSVEAQQFFDQGMTLYFGFNHVEAIRSFKKAAQLDPKAAMPHWGISIALGPNYNRDIDPVGPERNKAAFDAAQAGLKLAENGPKHELVHIQALTKRYTLDEKADKHDCEVEYSKAMREVVKAYPDDLDAATLYVESLMNLRPWKLWDARGKPNEGIATAVETLESILKRDPDHIGACHYYIHAMEASPNPERALLSSYKLLERVPWAGHLVHMPGHIFIHTGDYDLAAKANELGIKADEEYFKFNPDKGVYRMMYYNHNWQFLVYARMAEGNSQEAGSSARRLTEIIEPELQHMPMLQGFAMETPKVLLRFHKYSEVLQLPAPGAKQLVRRVFWHYARAVALAAMGKKEEAKKEVAAFNTIREEIPADFPFGVNPARAIFEVAAAVLDARLADDAETAVKHWTKAVILEDSLQYGEPPDWYYPIRESLGAALQRDKQAAEAEKVFRDDLQRNRRNGRSLFGLMHALKAQGKDREALLVQKQFEQIWKVQEKLEIDKY